MERIASHLADWTWNTEEAAEPSVDILGKGWEVRASLPARGTYKNLIVVRPALLADGECLADKSVDGKPAYRVSTEELGGYTISRKDTGHFVAGLCSDEWSKWEGKVVNVGY